MSFALFFCYAIICTCSVCMHFEINNKTQKGKGEKTKIIDSFNRTSYFIVIKCYINWYCNTGNVTTLPLCQVVNLRIVRSGRV